MSTHKKAARPAARSRRSVRHALPSKKRPVAKTASKSRPSHSRAKPSKKAASNPKNPNSKNSRKSFEIKAAALIVKGHDRGFVTYDEILKEFPQIENDITFLDDLYSKFATAGVDVLEGGGLLEVEDLKEKEKKAPHYSRGGPDSAYDSIQMYLKEIGQYPLINASMEKELAKRIQAGDIEAKNLLAKANLRLVVSIAKK